MRREKSRDVQVMGNGHGFRELRISNIVKPHCNAIYFQSIRVEHSIIAEKFFKCKPMHSHSIVDVQDGGNNRTRQGGTNSFMSTSPVIRIIKKKRRTGSALKILIALVPFAKRYTAIHNYHPDTSPPSQFHNQSTSIHYHVFYKNPKM